MLILSIIIIAVLSLIHVVVNYGFSVKLLKAHQEEERRLNNFIVSFTNSLDMTNQNQTELLSILSNMQKAKAEETEIDKTEETFGKGRNLAYLSLQRFPVITKNKDVKDLYLPGFIVQDLKNRYNLDTYECPLYEESTIDYIIEKIELLKKDPSKSLEVRILKDIINNKDKTESISFKQKIKEEFEKVSLKTGPVTFKKIKPEEILDTVDMVIKFGNLDSMESRRLHSKELYASFLNKFNENLPSADEMIEWYTKATEDLCRIEEL